MTMKAHSILLPVPLAQAATHTKFRRSFDVMNDYQINTGGAPYYTKTSNIHFLTHASNERRSSSVERFGRFLSNVFATTTFFLGTIITMGIPNMYYSKYGYNRRSKLTGAVLPVHKQDCITNLDYEWQKAFSKIQYGWITISGMSGVAITCITGSFQLLPTVNNPIVTSLVFSAFILACTGCACNVLYLGHRENIRINMASSWQRATERSFGFWTFISMPTLLISWAGTLCVVAVIYLAILGFGGSSSLNILGVKTADVTLLIAGIPVIATFVLSVNLICWVTRKVLSVN